MPTMLKNVRIAFCNSLHKPEQVNGEGQYRRGAVLLIAKDDPQAAMLNKLVADAIAAKWSNQKTREANVAEMKKKDRICFRDADEDGMAAKFDGFPGTMYLRANGKGGDTPEEAGAVVLLDQAKQPLTVASGKPYAGCYVNASVEVWVQDNQWGKRVNCTLRGVQFVRDGDAFGGGAPASADEFEAVTDGTTADDFA